MTHQEDPIHIKVEPISPPDSTTSNLQESCQSQSHASTLEVMSQQFTSQSWPPVASSYATPTRAILSNKEESKGTSSGTRTALKNKIQSGRRARGQEELVVKFEKSSKNQLTEEEIKKRERRKEQNRRAAQKCRVKKRKLQDVAVEQFKSLTEEYQMLSNETSELRMEVKKYKEILHEHQSSGHCKLVRIPESSAQTPQLYQAPTSAPVNSFAFSQPPNFPGQRSMTVEEIQIKKIARMLEMGDPQEFQISPSAQLTGPEQTESTGVTIEMIQDILLENEMDDFQDLSQTAQEEVPTHLETSITNNAPVNILKEGAEKRWEPGLEDIFDFFADKSTPKPRGVRNLNSEFAAVCALQNTSSPVATSSSNSFQQLQTTSEAAKPRLPPVLQNIGQLPNPDLYHSNINPGENPSHFVYNDSIPISPLSTCTSPPSNATSPSFFHSPAEILRASPGAMRCQEAPSPYIFQFPPEARFSPSS